MRAAAPAAMTVVRHSPRRGKAEAVRAGILAGLEQRAALVGFFDADLSTPLARDRRFSGRVSACARTSSSFSAPA